MSLDNVIYYRAREYQERKEVVIKVPIGDVADKQLFRLQASAASRLTHKNILKQNGPEELDDVLFSVSPVQPVTETLGSLLDRTGWLEVDDAIDIALQVASALEYAHGSGVMHLALHPDHILIGKDNSVMISEFGIEENSELDWAYSVRARRCPAQYQSPEQMDDTLIDHRSDLYSLGVIIFEMLTDRLPFDSANASHIRDRRARQSPMVPHVLFPEMPRMLSEIVLRLLESNPEKRFQSAAEVVNVLRRLRQLPSNETLSMDQASEVDARTDEETENTANSEGTGNIDSTLSVGEVRLAVRPLETPSAAVPQTPTVQFTGIEKQNHFAPFKSTHPAASSVAPNRYSIHDRQDIRDPRSPVYAKRAVNNKLSTSSWLLIGALILAGIIAVVLVLNLTSVHST
jgi:serine/threonine-protein kinase